ncbi:hypothetical protein G7Y89_g8775 [Cudoniella acicularis]|uniref:Uncharacterized protein n=1 Tax=Cudoniella acicularis TaxID=354080 RepID=A0A8H4W2K2_9HELO|nr:hypothetical protein G7Y89_g8775 [Cudoniella acicularis]
MENVEPRWIKELEKGADKADFEEPVQNYDNSWRTFKIAPWLDAQEEGKKWSLRRNPYGVACNVLLSREISMSRERGLLSLGSVKQVLIERYPNQVMILEYELSTRSNIGKLYGYIGRGSGDEGPRCRQADELTSSLRPLGPLVTDHMISGRDIALVELTRVGYYLSRPWVKPELPHAQV